MNPFQEFDLIIERHGYNRENDSTTLQEMKELLITTKNHVDNGLYPNSFVNLITNIKTTIDSLTRRLQENEQ